MGELPMVLLAQVLFGAHTALETVVGFKLFILGKGSMDGGGELSPTAKLYRRWHGAGLLALGGAGGLVLSRGQVGFEAGNLVAAVLTGFHAAAFAVHFFAASECVGSKGKAKGEVSFATVLLSPHLLLAG